MAEEAESPTVALARELAEELGLTGDLSPTLAVVEWRPPGIGGADLIMFVFWADLDDHQADAVTVTDPELAEARWCDLEQARHLLSPMAADLLDTALDARRSGWPIYVETVRQEA